MLRALCPDVKRKSGAGALFASCAFAEELNQTTEDAMAHTTNQNDDVLWNLISAFYER